jgi:glycerate 2-kinase
LPVEKVQPLAIPAKAGIQENGQCHEYCGKAMDENKKRKLERIFRAGLQAVDPEKAVLGHVKRLGSKLTVGDRTYSLDRYRRVIVVGAGKGTAPMAKALEDILGNWLTDGWIVVKYGHGLPLRRINVMEASHPIPDHEGMAATRVLLDQLKECTSEDLVLCAFSGGGSALLPAPRPPLDLTRKQETTRLLMECGAVIDEINAVRKHLSLSKGGGLAQIAYPATVVSLFLSDVIGDRPDVIASGPTAPDSSTFEECVEILDRCGLTGKVSKPVIEYLAAGARGLIEETPKPGNAVFEKVLNVVVGSNRAALAASREQAITDGFDTLVLSSRICGEAREVARVFAAIAKEIAESGLPIRPPACVLAGGETTVTIRGSGKGGRNQEMALAAAIDIDGWDRISILCAGTDGTDGPTNAAGAFADGGTCSRAREMELSPSDSLLRNDSYHFFESLGDLLITGPTRTNVMDVICMLVE